MDQIRRNAFLESTNSFLADTQEIPLQLSKITTPLKFDRNSQINSMKSLHKSPIINNNLSNLILNNETTINLKKEKFDGFHNMEEKSYEKMMDATHLNLDLFRNSFMLRKHEPVNPVFYNNIKKESFDLNNSINEKIEDLGENEFPLASIWDSPSKKIKLDSNGFHNFAPMIQNHHKNMNYPMSMPITNDFKQNNNNNNFDPDLINMIKQIKNEDQATYQNMGKFRVFPEDSQSQNAINHSSGKKNINFKTPYKIKSRSNLFVFFFKIDIFFLF
jgi:hypothetical protein